MADWFLKHDGPCACRFVRRGEFREAEQVEWCGLHANLRDELAALRSALESMPASAKPAIPFECASGDPRHGIDRRQPDKRRGERRKEVSR